MHLKKQIIDDKGKKSERRKMIAKRALEIFEEVFNKVPEVMRSDFADFLKREKLAVGKWGGNFFIFDLEQGRLFRMIPQPPSLKEAFLKKNQRYQKIEHCIKEFLFGTNWWATGEFIDLHGKDLLRLLERLEREGIDIVQYVGATI